MPLRSGHPHTASLFWLIGAASLFLGPLSYWAKLDDRQLTIPPTPAHRVNLVYSQQLVLLRHAQTWIPAGATYTTVAADPDEEMSLFMFSLSELVDRRPMPTSYYRAAVPNQGELARYVVAYRCETAEGRLRLLVRYREGCIYERIP